jgi:hypothetical protein
MISEKQLEANRNNALLSHGPVTDAGRKRSSMNARRRPAHPVVSESAPSRTTSSPSANFRTAAKPAPTSLRSTPPSPPLTLSPP